MKYCMNSFEKNPKYLEAVKEAKEFKRGIYQHFKGNYYVAEDVAIHSETLEPMVVYHSLINFNVMWVRPLKMFNEYVNGVPRFEYKISLEELKTIAGAKEE